MVIIIWVLTFPWVYYNRHALYDWYSIQLSSPGYKPKTMNSFVSDGDSTLSKHFLGHREKDENAFLEKIQPHMDKMAAACQYFQEAGERDQILVGAKWYDKNTRWTKNAESSSDRIKTAEDIHEFNREQLSDAEEPGYYWKHNIEPVLEALDYYKRALNYAGPELKAARRIDLIARAACREQEVVVAYSTFLYSSEEYLEKKIRQETDQDQLVGLDDKARLSLVWVRIRADLKETLPRLSEYLVGVQKLLSDTRFQEFAPEEADGLYERLLFVLESTTDAGQIREEKKLRLKRGKLLYKLALKNPAYYPNAIKQFEAASHFSDLTPYSPGEVYQIQAQIFEASLYKAKCIYNQGDYKKTYDILSDMYTRKVDGRESKTVEIDLLRDYHSLKRETLIKMGRLKEADEIITGYE